MSTELRVTAGHLDGLATTQRHAATLIEAAIDAVTAVDPSLRQTHGAIAAAVAHVQSARGMAGGRLGRAAEGLERGLHTSATDYTGTDVNAGRALGAQFLVK